MFSATWKAGCTCWTTTRKFLVKSWDNLTFDGSSIRGFTAQRESDLRLGMDWSAFYWGRPMSSGPGKVLVFGEVIEKDGSPTDRRHSRHFEGFCRRSSYKNEGYTLNAANEIEGFLFAGDGRRGALSRNRQIRVRQYRRLLPFLAGRSAPAVYRHGRGSAARHGFPERKGSPGSRALAV